MQRVGSIYFQHHMHPNLQQHISPPLRQGTSPHHITQHHPTSPQSQSLSNPTTPFIHIMLIASHRIMTSPLKTPVC
jgi:hypothetical protein